MKDIAEQLRDYLSDAHAIEHQSLQQLRTAPDIAGEPTLAAALRAHLGETESHERRVRALLEARGGDTSKFKELVMRAGGSAFVLFARSQPDTPGKLAAHALSYEALEWGAYDLLARTADEAGDTEAAEVARSIRDEERSMMDRIGELFDRTVEASLEKGVSHDPAERLGSYLADAHAIEAQSIQLLQSGRPMVENAPVLSALFEQHLAESRAQQALIEERLDALGATRSIFKDAAMRLGALDWGTFFLGHPDTAGKLACFAHAFEYLEIGGYEQLRRVAERAGDRGTVAAVASILEQERAAASKLAGTFDEAVRVALEEQGVR